jgi:hypothetical protein
MRVTSAQFRWTSTAVLGSLLAAVLVSAPVGPATASGEPSISIADASVVEGDTGKGRSVQFMITLSEPASVPVTVDYTIVAGTAAAPADINDLRGATKRVTFRPAAGGGLTATRKAVTAKVLPDLEVESDETFSVVLTNPTGGYAIGHATAVATVIDDDPGEGTSVSVGDVSIWEGDVGASPKARNVSLLWVNLSRPATETLTVDVAVVGESATPGTTTTTSTVSSSTTSSSTTSTTAPPGTTGPQASAGEDFTREFVKTLTFRPGQWQKSIAVPIVPDTGAEPDEVVSVSLSNPTGGVVLGRSMGAITILDDDRSTEADILMGSPQAALGQDPERGFNPQFTLNTAGWATNKQNGDKRSAGGCAGSFAGCSPENSAAGVNADYSEDGYYFTIDVDDTRPSGQPLRVEVYDPAFVYNGDGCGANQISAAQATTLQTNHPGDPYALQRYASGRTAWCTGDQSLTGNGGNNGSAIVTTYIVREPDNTPGDVTDNPAICAISFDPYGNPGQGSNAWINAARTGGNGIFDFLNSNANRGRESVRFRDHYRKWFPVCTVPSDSVTEGDYILQVRTNADLSSPLTSTTASLAGSAGSLENVASPFPNTGGHNRYMLRSGWGTSLSTPSGTTFTGVSLSAAGHLPISMNQLGAVAEFYLARITPDMAGRTLELTAWDAVDIGGGSSATYELLSPQLNATEATAAALTDCIVSRDGTTPPPGVTVSGCAVSGITAANYNGRNLIVQVPIPAGYSCEVANPLGCWAKVRVSVVGAGATPADTTTWSVRLL